MTDLAQTILFQSPDLVVIDKPPGLPTTGITLEDENCLQFHLMRHFGRMVWAVHQLDADTSGVNIFTLVRRQVAVVKKRMEAPSGVKEYLAFCHGEAEFDCKDVDLPIGFLDSERTQLGITASGRPARSQVSVLERKNGFSALKVRIFTGRTHQVRIHLSHLNHPLVGEYWYRPKPCTLWPRQALHAASVRFEDGLSPEGFAAPLAADLQELGRKLGFTGSWLRTSGSND
ncbi:MAG: RNA pseudouridine synthase [Planctomycetota bacterium]